MTTDTHAATGPPGPYQLVALDLDGTTIDHNLTILPTVRAAIAAVRARGVHLTFATGRQFAATVPFARDLGLTDPLICYQGALVRDYLREETLLHLLMPGPVAAAVTAYLLTTDTYPIAYVDERLYVAQQGAALDYYLQFHPEGAEIVVVPDLPATLRATPPTKILFIAPGASVERELARLGQQFQGQLAITRSHEHFGELTALGISKGVALAHLARHLGIPREQTLAIGDQENDLSMITWAGLGLAMGNAVPVVQQAAAATLPSIAAGGVAYALERYILSTPAE